MFLCQFAILRNSTVVENPRLQEMNILLDDISTASITTYSARSIDLEKISENSSRSMDAIRNVVNI